MSWSNFRGHLDRWKIHLSEDVSTSERRRVFDPSFKLQVAQMLTEQGLSVGQVCREIV